jgi:hypothetical protein
LYIEPRRILVQFVVHDYLGEPSIYKCEIKLYTYSSLSGHRFEDELVVRNMRFLGDLYT